MIWLVHLVNNQAVANKGWITRYFLKLQDSAEPIWRKSRNKKMHLQLAPNETFYRIPPAFIHRQLKHPQITKKKKLMLPASPYRFSTQSSQNQAWRANKYSILTVTELWLPVLGHIQLLDHPQEWNRGSPAW